MFHIVIAGICLTAALSPISAQLQQNSLGFQPTNNLTVAKLPGLTGWGSPPPPGGWSGPPPPPPPPPRTTATPTTAAPTTATPGQTEPDCRAGSVPVGTCDPPSLANLFTSQYLPSTDCSCFYECTFFGGSELFQCNAGLYFNPTLNVCDYPANTGCTQPPTRFGSNIVPNKV